MSKNLELVRSAFSRRTEIQSELRSLDTLATDEKRSFSEAEAARIETLSAELRSIDDRISANLEIEQRSQDIESGITDILGAVIDRDKGDVSEGRSLGQIVAESDEFRSFVEGPAHGQVAVTSKMELRSVTSTIFPGSTQRLDRVGQGVYGLAERPMLTDLLQVIDGTGIGAVEYVRDTTALTGANSRLVGTTAEGAPKRKSGMTSTVVTESPTTIASWVNITRRAARFGAQSYLDGRLRADLRRMIEDQVIGGTGQGGQLTGLVSQTGILTHTALANETVVESIRHGVAEAEAAGSSPSVVILNPSDAVMVDLTNVSSAGLHAVPSLAAAGAETVWGLRVIRSSVLPVGRALVLDPMSVALIDFEAITTRLTDSHDENFTSNILTLLVEAEVGLAVFDPVGIVKVDFDHLV